mgnify:CR=1 FL=1|tara:strand:- start:7140 stop:7463 length:324 start_codon:yes stop_codon:yes gene_type:complete
MSLLETQTVIKADLVDRVYEKIGFTRKDAEEAVDVVFDEIKSVLAGGESVRISGFASFNLRSKKARNARNPKTGEPIVIKARKVLSFKPSKYLLESTNGSFHDSGNS